MANAGEILRWSAATRHHQVPRGRGSAGLLPDREYEERSSRRAGDLVVLSSDALRSPEFGGEEYGRAVCAGGSAPLRRFPARSRREIFADLDRFNEKLRRPDADCHEDKVTPGNGQA